MDTTTIGAVGAAIGAAAGAVVSAAVVLVPVLVLWRRTAHKIRQESAAAGHQMHQESDEAALRHYEGVIGHLTGEIDRLQKQADRQAQHIDNLSGGLEQCREEHRASEAYVDRMYGWVEDFHEGWRRAVQRSRRDPDAEVPPLPPRPARPEGAGFRDRTLAQQREDLEALREPPEGGQL